MATTTVKKSVPRYRQLKKILCREIREKDLQPGKKIGSVVQLADKYKLSRTTVVKAVSELVDEGVLYSQVGNGTFVAKPVGDKTHTICFVVHSGDYISQPYFSQIVAGISTAADIEHYRLQIITSERAVRTIDGQAPYPRVKEHKLTDGLIVMDNALPDDQIIALSENMPVVLIDRKINGTNIACVCANDRGGTYEAISYLASLGHRRIGIIVASREWQTDKEKLLGYQSAVDDLGLDNEASLVADRAMATNPGGSDVKPVLDALLSLPVPPTAIFASSDLSAFKTLQILKEKGIKVPEDISVVGFDGCLSSVLGGRLLTTNQLPLAEMGRAATDTLLSLIGKGDVVHKETVFSPRLAIGQSSGKRSR